MGLMSGVVLRQAQDHYCLRESDVLLDPSNWLGNKGYVGNQMITPIKKPADVLS
jgi:hypothetical protein